MTHVTEILVEIDRKKMIVDDFRPLPTAMSRSLRQRLLLDLTWNSTAIEGNTLTILETKVVLEHGITIGGKSLREHLEVINHKDAIVFVEELASVQRPISHIDIRNIHHIVMRSIEPDDASVYRRENVVISGAGFMPPHHWHVQELMDELISWYGRESTTAHPVVVAARLHAEFARIHPFKDGNGRTARLLTNLHLLKTGYPISIVRNADRLEYFEALDRYGSSRDVEPMIMFLGNAVRRSLDLYIELLSKKPVSKNDSGQDV